MPWTSIQILGTLPFWVSLTKPPRLKDGEVAIVIGVPAGAYSFWPTSRLRSVVATKLRIASGLSLGISVLAIQLPQANW